MIPFCRSEGIGLIPWSPLARGLLARPPRDGYGDTARARTDEYAHKMYYQAPDAAVIARVAEVASRRGASMAQVALAWLLGRPGVVAPIIGASRMEHLEEALAALDLELETDVRSALEEPYRPHPVLGHE